MTLRWIFDPVPPSGKRTGGDPAEYSFRAKIDTLVRDVVQNSLDARIEGQTAQVAFRIIDLDGEYRTAFLAAIDWDGLEDNLAAVPEKRGGLAILRARESLATSGLRLLVIEDRGTRGLEGPEERVNDEEPNPYCALVKDDLYSDKDDSSAGGSFGLGKSVLWAFSGLKTVLFSSIPRNPPESKSGLRLVGKASLPWHETADDGPCAGSGWFGTPVHPNTDQRRAESVWGRDAERVAAACLCARDEGATGLTEVIVGFAEPGEEDRDVASLVKDINDAALESFWPAIAEHRLAVEIEALTNDTVTQRLMVDPWTTPGYLQLSQVLAKFRRGELSTRSQLQPGEECVFWIGLEVPERTLDPLHPDLTSPVALLVRVLADGEDAGAAMNRVARFRGRGMIIRSDQQPHFTLGARTFLAAVLAGEAAGSGREFTCAEQFLRAAEPPAHDEWVHDTRQIKQHYKSWGTRTKLAHFDTAIRDAIARLVAKPREPGGSLPKALLRFLRFGGGGGGGSERFLSVTRQRAEVVDGKWSFGFHCRRIRPGDEPWIVIVKLKYGRDGGGSDLLKAIGKIVAADATSIEIRNGKAVLEFPPGITAVTVEGTTDPDGMPAVGTRAVLSIHVDGESKVIAHA
jgi:hypothetical protein